MDKNIKRNGLKKYYDLINQHPLLFKNLSDPFSLKILADKMEIQKNLEQMKEKNILNGNPPEWADIGVLVDDPWFYVIRDLIEFPDGSINGYIRFVNKKSLEDGCNVVIFIRKGDKVLLIKHFRHEMRGWVWECPRGFGERGLSGKENACKELEEEIGVIPKSLCEIGQEDISGGNGKTIYYLANLSTELHYSIEVDRTEGISEYKFLSINEFEKWIVEGKLSDLYTIKAYTLAKLKGFL